MPSRLGSARGSVITPVSAAPPRSPANRARPGRPGCRSGRGSYGGRCAGCCDRSPAPDPFRCSPCSRPDGSGRPARIRSRVAPIAVRSARICREVGLMSNDTRGWVWSAGRMAATTATSRRPGLADEPTTTWMHRFGRRPPTPAPRCPAIRAWRSAVPGGTGRSLGHVVAGSRIGRQLHEIVHPALPGKEFPDPSSAGNTVVVAPNSAPILAITCLSIADRSARPVRGTR